MRGRALAVVCLLLVAAPLTSAQNTVSQDDLLGRVDGLGAGGLLDQSPALQVLKWQMQAALQQTFVGGLTLLGIQRTVVQLEHAQSAWDHASATDPDGPAASADLKAYADGLDKFRSEQDLALLTLVGEEAALASMRAMEASYNEDESLSTSASLTLLVAAQDAAQLARSSADEARLGALVDDIRVPFERDMARAESLRSSANPVATERFNVVYWDPFGYVDVQSARDDVEEARDLYAKHQEDEETATQAELDEMERLVYNWRNAMIPLVAAIVLVVVLLSLFLYAGINRWRRDKEESLHGRLLLAG